MSTTQRSPDLANDGNDLVDRSRLGVFYLGEKVCSTRAERKNVHIFIRFQLFFFSFFSKLERNKTSCYGRQPWGHSKLPQK